MSTIIDNVHVCVCVSAHTHACVLFVRQMLLFLCLHGSKRQRNSARGTFFLIKNWGRQLGEGERTRGTTPECPLLTFSVNERIIMLQATGFQLQPKLFFNQDHVPFLGVCVWVLVCVCVCFWERMVGQISVLYRKREAARERKGESVVLR